MTLRECLTAFGFRFVVDVPGEVIADNPDTGIYVYLRPGKTRVEVGNAAFPGCRTVGDLRQLIRLRGHTVPGDKGYPGEDPLDPARLKWARLDGITLEYAEV
jgi:hypothetical protein